VRRGETLGPDVSMLKINQTELFQRITEAMLDVAGEEGAPERQFEDRLRHEMQMRRAALRS